MFYSFYTGHQKGVLMAEYLDVIFDKDIVSKSKKQDESLQNYLKTEIKKDKSLAEKLLDRAMHYRDFEIKASWERSKYFILFLGALFIAYYTMKQHTLADGMGQIFYMTHPTPTVPHWMFVLITGLGTIISFIWYWVNRGSKMIYENWEHHIDFIEKECILGTISRIHCYKGFKKDWFGLKPISPSKANIFVSWLISFAFLVLFLYEIGVVCCICDTLVVFYKTNKCCIDFILLLVFCYFLFYLPTLLKSRSFGPEIHGDTGEIFLHNRITKTTTVKSHNK